MRTEVRVLQIPQSAKRIEGSEGVGRARGRAGCRLNGMCVMWTGGGGSCADAGEDGSLRWRGVQARR